MSQTQTPQLNPGTVAAVREQLMDGLIDLETFAEATGKTARTVAVYISQGMPATYIGRTPYVIVEEASKWLRARGTPSMTTRKRGRNRQAA